MKSLRYFSANRMEVKLYSDAIVIYDDKGDEIVYWDKNEWIEDPNLVFNIVRAVIQYSP